MNPHREFGRDVDFGRTAVEYRRYRHGFPSEFFEFLFRSGYVKSGHRALDLGTGTGTVARGLVQRGVSAIGIDRSEEMLAAAATIDRVDGLSIEYICGVAESLVFRDGSFDLVVAGQCWHWFDRPGVGSEVERVLRAGGRFVIAHFDWLPIPGNVVEATEAMILKHNERWSMAGGHGIYPQWLADMAVMGLESIETYSFDKSVPYSHEAWRGRIRASAGVKASMTPDRVEEFDRELGALLRSRFAEDPLEIPHRVWMVTGTKCAPRGCA